MSFDRAQQAAVGAEPSAQPVPATTGQTVGRTSRKLPLMAGQTSRPASAPCLLRRAVDEHTGELLAASMLARRVGWAIDLVAAMVTDLVAAHWNATDVDLLAAGHATDGRNLPSSAWMALRRLGWMAAAPLGVKVNDRIVRIAQEQAGRTLRGANWRAALTAAILTTWPADPAKRTAEQWDQVRAAALGGQNLLSSVIKARTRQIAGYAGKHGRLPVDLFELEPAPRTARMLLLAACDRQQATIQRADELGRALLRLQLPTRPDPRSYADWTWVACPISLPPTVPPGAVLNLPTLHIVGGKVRAALDYTHAVPKSRRTSHTVALGVDWGLNTLLSAGAARQHPDATITALGTGAQYRAAGVLAKQHRLRRHGERLHAKADHHQRLIAGDPQHPLIAKHDLLRKELGHVADRRTHLNDALAWSAARWTVDQAFAAEATVIYLEDLRSMEARGMGRTMNTRLSQQIRGRIAERIRHLAGEVGIAVVTVPAKNTSKHCPHCLTPLRHRKAPDRPTTPGWKWAICPNPDCGWQSDRDQGAWQRIAARGLTHQTNTIVDRTSGTKMIRTVEGHFEAHAVITPPETTSRDRSKTAPTRHSTTRPTPRRRRTPSPAGCHRPAGKRPEGHAPTDRRKLPRAAHRNQDVITISTPIIRHKPKGAALGAGFHLHAHATPPRWADLSSGTTPEEGARS